MKIVLINPPASGTRADDIVAPPLGLAYLAAALAQAGHRVKIIDAFALGLGFADLERGLRDYKPDLVGVTGMTPIIDAAYRVLQSARSHTKYLVLGGAHVSAVGPEVFKEAPQLDAALAGEAEQSLVELVSLLEQGEENRMREIPGVLVPGSENTKCPVIEHLDELPMPARELLPHALYRHPLLGPGPVATMITSRGCPFSCIFCDKSVSGVRFRGHSPQRVLTEIEHILLHTRLPRIIIYDDLFTLDRERVIEICRGIVTKGWKIRWKCEGRVGRVDPEMLRWMKKAGCEIIAYGVESANQHALDYLKKGITKDQARQTFEMTKEAGIKTLAYFILGIPGETFEQELETIRFAKQIADYAQFGLLAPFPGTPLYEEAQARGWYHTGPAKGPAEQGMRRPLLVTEEWTEPQLIAILKRAHREFYYRPAYIWSRVRDLSGPGEFISGASSALRLARWLLAKRQVYTHE